MFIQGLKTNIASFEFKIVFVCYNLIITNFRGLSFFSDKGKKKLEQLAEYSLFGNIASMKPVRIGNNTRDSLILSFRDAKVILYFLALF